MLWIITALSLALCFPRIGFGFFAWIAFIPLMVSLDGKSPKQGFRAGFWCGLLFFGISLRWLFHVTEWFSVIAAVGVAFLLMYLALYFALFGLIYCSFKRINGLWKLFLVPAVWAVLEWLRDYLFTGFGWLKIGHSQQAYLPLIQIADMAGVYGVSFVVVLVNMALKDVLLKRPWAFKGCVAAGVLLLGVVGYGQWRLYQIPAVSPAVKIAVVQGNIPQEMKWQEDAWVEVMEQYKALTLQAAAAQPDLIIWPETAFPGFLWDDIDLFDDLRDFVARTGIPLLFGSIAEKNGRYYNTAVLLAGDGRVLNQHAKMHLVPFGEFLPFRSLLEKIVPIEDFTAGELYTLFPFGGGHFSVLICFEDTVSRLTRNFVSQGSGLLINVTNDGWFKDSAAPFMHMQAAAFRAVENRRTLVRAANTGVSGFVSPDGSYRNLVRSADNRNTYVPGVAFGIAAFDNRLTWYTRYGDMFILLCLIYSLLGWMYCKRL